MKKFTGITNKSLGPDSESQIEDFILKQGKRENKLILKCRVAGVE